MIMANPKLSTYTLDMDGCDKIFPTFHAAELKLHIANDKTLPNLISPLARACPEEHEIKLIINSRCRGHSWQFLIGWVSFRPEDDEWLSL